MNYFVIGPVHKLSFEQEIEINHDFVDLKILEDYSEISRILEDPYLEKNIGSIALKILLSNSIHFSMHKVDPTETNPIAFANLMVSLQKFLTQNYFLSLWLVKDNSVNTGDFYWWHYDSGSFITDKPAILFSNAKGEYSDTFFSKDEVRVALDWQRKLDPYMQIIKEVEEVGMDFLSNAPVLSEINNHNKRNLELNENRIKRSIRMITIARSQSFLPAKIASYISAIEALISSNRESLVMQVAERVPKILGGSIDDKKENHDKLRAAYGIRNKYVHGDKVTEHTANKLDQVSEDIDSIARSLLIKMIDEYDFTKDYGEKDMTKWYEKHFMF